MKLIVRTAAGLALAAGLAGCASPKVAGADIDALTPLDQYKAQVADEPHEVALAVHAGGLSDNQAAALAAFADDWRAMGGAPVQVQVPAGPEPAAARRFGEAVRQALAENGVPPQAINMLESGEPGVMRVGFLRRVAVLPECGREWTDFRRSMHNKVSPNFGCSVTANMAAQIADPSDLLGPRPGEPADAGRRATVTDKYRRGQATGAQIDERASGVISSAVQ